MKTGILFDLDGTLLDTLEDLMDATNYALASYGYPARTLQEVRRFVGNGAENLIRQALPENRKEDLPRVLEAFRVYYQGHCQVKTKPFAGVISALKTLRETYPIAIVSNKPDSAVKTLCAEYFPGIYALGEAEDCPRKPAADMVFKAMAAIGAESCVYVGDSEVDVMTANNAGVPCVCVLWGFRDRVDLETAGGHIYCDHMEDLVKSIEETIHGQ